jgi:hypothetical protein
MTIDKIYTIAELSAMPRMKAVKYAKIQGIPRAKHPKYNELNHPKCSNEGCHNTKVVMDWHWTSGAPIYRPICEPCHQSITALKYAKKNNVDWIKDIGDVVAHKNGFNSTTEYLNSKHPYRQYRKDYCENIDKRLGFSCTTNIIWTGMLDVDHIDENPSNNDPFNFQTLCACCHRYKGNIFIKKYGKTPGRKTLGVKH